MLPDRYLQLLTAYVDGELSGRQRRYIARLLDRSTEARTLVNKLQQDAQTLHNLPRPTLEIDLAESFLNMPAAPSLQKTVRPALSRPSGTGSVWTAMAVAASLLLLVSVASFVYFSRPATKQGSPIAKGDPKDSLAHHKDKRDPQDTNVPKGNRDPIKDKDGLAHKEPEDPEPAEGGASWELERPDAKPGKKDKKEAVLTSGQDEKFSNFERVEFALPWVIGLAQLDKPEAQQELLAELKKGNAFRNEFLLKDTKRGLQSLRDALADRKIELVIDPVAQGRLAKQRFKNDYAIFLYDLTPAEWTALIQKTAEGPPPSTPRKASDGRLDGSLVVARLTKLDAKELNELFGDNPFRSGTKASESDGVDFEKIPGETLKDKGKKPKDKARREETPTLRRTGLVVVFGPGRPRIPSPEVKAFLENRKPVRPGTIQVLLVLRGI
jgi:hypothetical protein